MVIYCSRNEDTVSQVGKQVAGIDYTQTLSKTIPRYLTMRLSKPAYMKIPILNLFGLEILGLYSIVLSTRGKICVKVGGT